MDGRSFWVSLSRGLVCAAALISMVCGVSAQTTVQANKQASGPAQSSQSVDGAFQVFIRIQSDMNRLAAGKRRGQLPTGMIRDPLESVVDAYVAYLQHDASRMDAAILVASTGVGTSALSKLSFEQNDFNTYMVHLAYASHSSQPLLRLMAAVRTVDAALYQDVGGMELLKREERGMRSQTLQSPSGLWLRLPCRTLREHAQDFINAGAALRALPGPLLDCPTDVTGVEQLALIASQPRLLKPRQWPPTPGRHEVSASATPGKAARSMRSSARVPVDINRNAEEASLKRAAAKDAKGELDYALFLHAFRPQTPSRDTQIQRLLDDVQAKSYVASRPVADFQSVPYDGSDNSLIPHIILASMGDDQSVFQYPIPCDVLRARPGLLDATKPYYFSNRDNFLPQSGCVIQVLDEYPGGDVQAFMAAATDADGHFIDNFDGTMVYGFEKHQNEAQSALQLGPKALRGVPGFGSLDYPYQAWGYLSLNNYRTSLRIKAAYETARRKLADYYGTMQTNHDEAMTVAGNGLFALVFGGDCGKRPPDNSTRLLLLKHASLASIEHALSSNGDHDDLLAGCEQYAGIDPLIMIAAGNEHEALDALLAHGQKVNDSNNIGKTALMEASQFDQFQSVMWLLEHGANANASTWANNAVGANGPLQHDARTPLMYAAANGSLSIIQVLISAGADPYQTDSKGYRAIDYLLGYGPTPPNPVLADEERLEAQALLY